jgi:tetratricopeptide (TPR) repeat protein
MMYKYKLFIYCCLMVWVLSCNNKSRTGKIPEVDPELVNSGEPELSALNDAIAEDPDNAVYYFKRAKVYYQAGLTSSAYSDINTAIHLDSTFVDYYVLLAKVYYRFHRTNTALKSAIMAEELNSNDPELFILMSQIYLDMKNESKSDYYFNKASAIAPFHSDVYVLKGRMSALKGDTSGAISNLLVSIRKDPRNIDSYKELVKIYDANHQYDSTMVFLIKGRAINSREPFFYFYEGKFFENVNFKQSAKTSYETALKYDSSFFSASYHLGLMNLREENNDMALKNFINAVRYEPNLKEANLYAGELYEKMNSGEKAIPYYQRVLISDSSNGKAKEALERLYILFPQKRKATAIKDTVKTDSVNVDSINVAKAKKTEAGKEVKKETKKPSDKGVIKKDTLKAPKATGVNNEVKKEEEKKEVSAPANVNTNINNHHASDTDTAKVSKPVKKKKIKKDTIQ